MPGGFREDPDARGVARVNGAAETCRVADLDEGDNDHVVLWSYVIEALRRSCPAVSMPASPQIIRAASIVDMVLPRLVNELDDLGEVTLMLDDFHRLSDGPARPGPTEHRMVHRSCTAALQLVLLTRTEPAFPLAALRGHGELLELRADALRFTSGEADAFLNGRLELGLTPEEVDGLVGRMKGWPAGLYLTALSLRRTADRQAFINELGASSRHLLDFLETEVLQDHDPPMQALMLRSSILERLSGPLCDAVLDQQHSALMLGELSRSNLFLIPTTKAGGTASTRSSAGCCGWSSNGANQARPRRCTAGRMPGIAITARPLRPSRMRSQQAPTPRPPS
jgi:ATP/maltotriose-dependent transcriptional regulator MalT